VDSAAAAKTGKAMVFEYPHPSMVPETGVCHIGEDLGQPESIPFRRVPNQSASGPQRIHFNARRCYDEKE